MKKLLLPVAGLFAFSASSQTFFDNFDSYTAGQKLAAQSSGAWTTWSNAPGGNEDVLVSSADAASAPNSVYFSTNTQAGGPTDLIKNFGVMNTGQFSLEFNIKVQNGKAGYFNLQKTATPGTAWALDVFFTDNGAIQMSNTSGTLLTGSYTQNTWFNFRMDINFNTNTWEAFIDDSWIGSFSNPINQVASIDIFPTDQNSPYSCGYFIDDFSYTVTPYTLPAINAGVTSVAYPEGNIAGNNVTPKVKIRNLGTSTINSFSVDVTYNGTTISKSVTNANLASLAEMEVTMDNTIQLATATHDMIASVYSVNGTLSDDDAADDEKTITVSTIVPAAGKMVVGEEATGTWCQYCPRGAVFMDKMEQKYAGFWAGIAVHNGDPMTNSDYDSGMGSLISGYPSMVVDRMAAIDPSAVEEDFLDRITVAPTAMIENGATWDPATRTLQVSVAATFNASANNNYKLAVVLTEDDVTGSTNGYRQVNAYANNAMGPMGGYESLPNPVPASQMVYDHVARAIEPSFTGYANSFPATVNAGETHVIQATFVLPASWDESKIHIVGFMLNPQGKIDNAGKATISEAVDNGLQTGPVVNLGITDLDQPDAALSVYPNPASDHAVISFNLATESEVSIRIADASGKLIAARNYGTLSGSNTIDLNTSNLAPGMYTVEIVAGQRVARKHLVIGK